ncbi:MAG: hypothetical protein K0U20_08640 [Proteobacteria bacterium]|nr:hypothetical protein [Pseudomonadota bacterium]
MQNKIPGVTRGIDSNTVPGDTEVVAAMDATFCRNGRTWRVTSVVDTFLVGTAIDAQLDDNGEPVRESDIIRVVFDYE